MNSIKLYTFGIGVPFTPSAKWCSALADKYVKNNTMNFHPFEKIILNLMLAGF